MRSAITHAAYDQRVYRKDFRSEQPLSNSVIGLRPIAGHRSLRYDTPQTIHFCVLPAACYLTEIPPSTKNSDPVANFDSSDARNTAIPAISSGSPNRPIGCIASNCGRTTGSSCSTFVNGVVIDPGTMLLHRIPYFARSAAITRVKPITDAFDDEYALHPAPLIVNPVGDPALMIDPPLPASIINRVPYLQVRKTPRAFTA